MYVPKDATIQEPMKTQTPTTSANAYYLYLNRLFTYLSSLLLILNDMTPLSTEFSNKIIFHTEYLNSIREFDYEIVKKFQSGNFNLMMLSEINAWATQCAYTKVFDETLAEDDPDNYYMEREWRSIKSVDFALEDIQKVYLPSQHYKEKFLSEFPEYTGDFWLFDAC